MLHEAGAAFAADDAAVDRMVAVALDVANLPVLDVDFDAAAAGAHVAGGAVNRVGDDGREVYTVAFLGCGFVGEGTLGRCRIGGRSSGHEILESPPPETLEFSGPKFLGAEFLAAEFLLLEFLGPGPRM
jgi:hypothetical protein